MDRLSVAILVPVLARPHRVAPLLASIAATTPEPHAVYFLPDADDRDEMQALADAGATVLLTGTTGYAPKLNQAVRMTDEPLVFLGADDISFRARWLETARAHMTEGVQVVGVNDLIRRRQCRERHATHFLMTRAYAELPTIDDQPGPLFTGYDHSFVDDELIATATKRGAYAYAEGSHVAHVDHPMTAGGKDDETYRKGRARFRWDRRVFHRRSHLWT